MSAAPRLLVLAPSPLLTITIEARPDGAEELHAHAGGQGVWIARLCARLGCDVVLCGPFGGETGEVTRGLVERDGVHALVVPAGGANGSYVHDRRGGGRTAVATIAPPVLDRHELDQLYDLALMEGLDADGAVLGGPDDPRVLAPDTYRRLAADLSAAALPVVADLSGPFLEQAVAGGVTLAKASHEDLVDSGRARSARPEDLVTAMRELAGGGAGHVVVTRAAEPALALLDGELFEIVVPQLQEVDHRGAGDSMTAGLATALARRAAVSDAVRLGAAAGALNITRHGLGTGDPQLIERFAKRVDLRRIG